MITSHKKLWHYTLLLMSLAWTCGTLWGPAESTRAFSTGGIEYATLVHQHPATYTEYQKPKPSHVQSIVMQIKGALYTNQPHSEQDFLRLAFSQVKAYQSRNNYSINVLDRLKILHLAWPEQLQNANFNNLKVHIKSLDEATQFLQHTRTASKPLRQSQSTSFFDDPTTAAYARAWTAILAPGAPKTGLSQRLVTLYNSLSSAWDSAEAKYKTELENMANHTSLLATKALEARVFYQHLERMAKHTAPTVSRYSPARQAPIPALPPGKKRALHRLGQQGIPGMPLWAHGLAQAAMPWAEDWHAARSVQTTSPTAAYKPATKTATAIGTQTDPEHIRLGGAATAIASKFQTSAAQAPLHGPPPANDDATSIALSSEDSRTLSDTSRSSIGGDTLRMDKARLRQATKAGAKLAQATATGLDYTLGHRALRRGFTQVGPVAEQEFVARKHDIAKKAMRLRKQPIRADWREAPPKPKLRTGAAVELARGAVWANDPASQRLGMFKVLVDRMLQTFLEQQRFDLTVMIQPETLKPNVWPDAIANKIMQAINITANSLNKHTEPHLQGLHLENKEAFEYFIQAPAIMVAKLHKPVWIQQNTALIATHVAGKLQSIHYSDKQTALKAILIAQKHIKSSKMLETTKGLIQKALDRALQDTAWKATTWKPELAATDIQRVYRGHRGRQQARERKTVQGLAEAQDEQRWAAAVSKAYPVPRVRPSQEEVLSWERLAREEMHEDFPLRSPTLPAAPASPTPLTDATLRSLSPAASFVTSGARSRSSSVGSRMSASTSALSDTSSVAGPAILSHLEPLPPEESAAVHRTLRGPYPVDSDPSASMMHHTASSRQPSFTPPPAAIPPAPDFLEHASPQLTDIQAATKIQAAIRGLVARKKLRPILASHRLKESITAAENLEELTHQFKQITINNIVHVEKNYNKVRQHQGKLFFMEKHKRENEQKLVDLQKLLGKLTLLHQKKAFGAQLEGRYQDLYNLANAQIQQAQQHIEWANDKLFELQPKATPTHPPAPPTARQVAVKVTGGRAADTRTIGQGMKTAAAAEAAKLSHSPQRQEQAEEAVQARQELFAPRAKPPTAHQPRASRFGFGHGSSRTSPEAAQARLSRGGPPAARAADAASRGVAQVKHQAGSAIMSRMGMPLPVTP